VHLAKDTLLTSRANIGSSLLETQWGLHDFWCSKVSRAYLQAKSRQWVVLAFLLCCPLRVFSSDPVPTDRLPYGGTWAGLAGVSGGIPNRTNIYTTLTSSATYSQINTAIANCPSNSVVHLSAGTYSINGQVFLQRDGVTLRGDTDAKGVATTILNCSVHITITMGDNGFNTLSGWNTVNVTGGISRGSMNITLASVPNGCVAGALLWLSAPPGGAVGGGSFALFLGSDPFVQIVKVTAVNGTSVSFYPAINADYLRILKASTPTRTVYHRMGIENLKLQGGQLVYVESLGTDECWAKNLIVSNSPAGQARQFWLYTVNRFEIRHCDIGTIDAAGSDAYAILGQDCTGVLVEDNYFHNSPNFYPQLGAQNCVFSYNFVTNCPYTQVPRWLSQIVYNHGCHCCYNLYEGNVTPAYYDDGLSNNVNDPTSTRCNTHLRERIVGWDGSDGGKIYNCRALTVLDPGENDVVAGCLLGKVGFVDNYQPLGGTSMTKAIYYLDPGVKATIGRYGNWNAVDKGVRSGEALAGGQVVANSYLYGSKPSWLGGLGWPPFEPSRCTPAALSATNIPAGYRAVFGADPPAGPVNRPPVCLASASINAGLAPLAVAFSSLGSYDPEGVSLSYFWNFGDGTTSTAANPSHTYSTPRGYSVTLTVSDGVNATASSDLTISVLAVASDQPPVVPAKR
jgi:hypothetical protein